MFKFAAVTLNKTMLFFIKLSINSDPIVVGSDNVKSWLEKCVMADLQKQCYVRFTNYPGKANP
jgi:hypothetical protein